MNINKEIEAKNFFNNCKPYEMFIFIYSSFLNDIKENKLPENDKPYYGTIKNFLKNDSKIFEIKEEIQKLLFDTSNKIYYRNTPFECFLINNKIKIDEIIYNGFLIINNNNNNFLTVITLMTNNYGILPFASFIGIKNESTETNMFDNKINITKKQRNKVSSFICNFLDLLENNKEDYEEVVIRKTKKENDNRERRGKIRLPDTTIIRPTTKLKRYIDDLEEHRKNNKYSHKFMVRGHWKHFNADRYKSSKGKSIWIKPFFKGDGLYINKKIIIK